MRRKDFISTIPAFAAIGSIIPDFRTAADPDELPAIVPAYLKAGDLIGITCPAGYVKEDEVKICATQLEKWGFRVRIGKTVGTRDHSFGGTDAERLTDLQEMLDDREIRAIMCARGGYGSVRIVEKLKWNKFKLSPKWIIGFSDITVLHSYINRNLGIASIHSKMCGGFPENWDKAEEIQRQTIESIHQAIIGKAITYPITPSTFNRPGTAKGQLVGGNLKTLESLAGSKSDIKTDNKILFVEDTGEYLYSIDRMFWNLEQSGKLKNLAGLIVGGFRIKKSDDADDEFGLTLQEIVMEKIKNYRYPVCFDFPVGHQKNNFAMKCGVMHMLQVTANSVSFMQTI